MVPEMRSICLRRREAPTKGQDFAPTVGAQSSYRKTYITWIESASRVLVANKPASTIEAPLRGFGFLVVAKSVLLTSQPFQL